MGSSRPDEVEREIENFKNKVFVRLYKCVPTICSSYNPLHPMWLLLGSPMPMNPLLIKLHPYLHRSVFQPYK